MLLNWKTISPVNYSSVNDDIVEYKIFSEPTAGVFSFTEAIQHIKGSVRQLQAKNTINKSSWMPQELNISSKYASWKLKQASIMSFCTASWTPLWYAVAIICKKIWRRIRILQLGYQKVTYRAQAEFYLIRQWDLAIGVGGDQFCLGWKVPTFAKIFWSQEDVVSCLSSMQSFRNGWKYLRNIALDQCALRTL